MPCLRTQSPKPCPNVERRKHDISLETRTKPQVHSLDLLLVQCWAILGSASCSLAGQIHADDHFPANTRYLSNVVLMLGQRRRRWTIIKTPLGDSLVSTGLHVISVCRPILSHSGAITKTVFTWEIFFFSFSLFVGLHLTVPGMRCLQLNDSLMSKC